MEQRARIEIARVVDARVVEDETSPAATASWLGYIYPGVRRHTVYTIEAVLGASAMKGAKALRGGQQGCQREQGRLAHDITRLVKFEARGYTRAGATAHTDSRGTPRPTRDTHI